MSAHGDLEEVQVRSAEPERIRVSVFGGRTQLDIALPLDVPVAAVTPDLARLIRTRDTPDDEAAGKEERRTFWVLSRFDSGDEIRPNQTLRESGVVNGELLRLAPERALSPPTLYDDVVDAAARLNRASYAGWTGASARWMALLGTQLAVLGLVLLMLQPGFPALRPVIVGLNGVVVVALVAVAAVAHRSYDLDDVAALLGAATIPLTAAIAWTMLSGLGAYGVALTCAAVLVAVIGYHRLIGAGHWAFLATSVFVGGAAVAAVAHALGVRLDIVCVTMAAVNVLICLAIPRLTAKLGRGRPPAQDVPADSKEPDLDFENPFDSPSGPAAIRADGGGRAGLPSAEAVWEAARSAAVTRSALSSGFAAFVAVVVAVLLRETAPVRLPAFVFALVCAAVLALHGRCYGVWFERAALWVPAVMILVLTCALAQNGVPPIPVAAVATVLAVAVGAVIVGLTRGGKPGMAKLLAYAEYCAVAALLPVALWVVGPYERLMP